MAVLAAVAAACRAGYPLPTNWTKSWATLDGFPRGPGGVIAVDPWAFDERMSLSEQNAPPPPSPPPLIRFTYPRTAPLRTSSRLKVSDACGAGFRVAAGRGVVGRRRER